MPLKRVYVAVTPVGLRSLATSGVLGPAPLGAHTVTGAVTRGAFGGDEEDQEYAAWQAAAGDARQLVGEAGMRVVVSADVDSALIEDELPETRAAREDALGVEQGVERAAIQTSVRLSSAVPLRRIVAFHVDEVPGGQDADLLWFDVTELNDVVAHLDES